MKPPRTIHLWNGSLSARISTIGAELKSFRKDGQEFIWPGDPQWWSYSAPLLFPIVGRLRGGRITHEEQTLQLPPHGFARDLDFVVEDASPTHAQFSLRASPASRANYPFEFAMRVIFELTANGIVQKVRIRNGDMKAMPGSFGFHPGFLWPLGDGKRDRHRIEFTHVESPGVYTIDREGCLAYAGEVLQMNARSLELDDSLFSHGAMVLNPVQSNGLRFVGPDGPLLKLQWEGCTQLGLWSLPGAPFVCFEPWCGHADPQGFSGSLTDKPGGFILQPGDSRTFSLSMEPESR